MFKLLGKFVITKYLVRVIEKLYHEFQIKIKVGKCKEKIDYQTGMKRVNNLAPILFIIVIQLIYELLGKTIRGNYMSKIEFCHDTFNAYYKGERVLRQKFKKKFTTKDEAFLLLYVDDGASLFNSRNDDIVGTNIIFNQMKRMGLNMHVGSGKKASKTEAVFFPSRSKISEWLRKGKIKSIFSSEE